jgi:hypothetical protein
MNQPQQHKTVKEAIQDWALWYFHNRDIARSIEQELAFQKRTIDGLIDMLAITAQELEELKGKQKPGKPLLYVPTGRYNLHSV